MRPALYAGTGVAPPPRPQPRPRDPLPPFDIREDPSDPTLQLHVTLPGNLTIPSGPDRNFWRANCWSTEVANTPFVPGGTSSIFPNRWLSWFADEYVTRDPGSLDRALYQMALNGNTHYLMSRGGGFGRQSPSAYASQAAYIKSWGFWVTHMLTSKDIDLWPIPDQANTMFNTVQPYLDALMNVNALDKASLGWELDAFWDPDQLAQFKHRLANYCRGYDVDFAAHFTTYKSAWQPNGQPRAAFWNDGICKELWYQTHPTAPLRTNQAHANDEEVQASGLQDNGVRLVAFEVDASAQFDGPSTEAYGAMRSFGLLCTPGPWPFNGGYANGTWQPNGQLL